ncbi:MAG: hypothetical protein IKB72_04700 [Ruminococcus sp.]|nr:hypothetical protein [Ruminococcus sp.]
MLECRVYSYKELSEYLGTTSPTGTKRKLTKYEVEFEAKGIGDRSTYQITAVKNPFKVFAVFDLEASPQTDFRKFSYFVYLILTDETFCGMGAEMMEEHLRSSCCPMSRQTISKYIKRLTDFNLVDFSSEFVYYRVYKKFGVQTHDVVSREEYAEAWRVYWEYKDEAEEAFASSRAFQAMYTWFGGVPRKQKLIEKNGIYNELIDWLVDILIEDYGVE